MLISGGNIVDVVDGVKSVMAEYESENLSFTLIEDQSEYATESVSTVWSSLILGALLAMLIIILFLKNIRTSLIISVSMPLSVLGALSGMYLCGVEMNVVAMCGLAIGIGMLVDNSIVVIENITRHMDMGKTREEASFEGAKEVALPLIASTLTTVAVFFPIMLIEGMTQMIFKDLSIAVIFSLVFSLIVAITVIPTLFAKFGRVSKFAQNGSESLRLARANGKVIYTRTENLYKSVLVKTLKAKPIVILLAIVILASTVMLGLSAGYEFIPAVDKGVLEITLDTNGEEAVSNLQAAVDMETYLFDTYDNIQTISTAVGGSDIFGGGNETVVLQVILDNTNVATSEMVSDLRRLQIDGVDISVAEIDGIVATFVPDASGIAVSILGESDEQMAEISDAVIQALGSVDGIGNITTSLEQDTVEYQITIDETNEIVQSYGVSNVIMLLRYGISSQNITTIKSDGEVLDVVVTFAESEIDTLAKIQDLYVVPPTTFKPYGVKLSEVAEITEVSKTASITKENGLQVLTISMQLFEGVMGDVSDEVTAVVAEVMEEYQDYSMESSGTMAYLFESFEGLFIALGISLFLVFAIIASQFESIKQAFAIILSVPFAFSGAFIAIAISGDTLNVVSLIGMIMLVGVVVNNAIVMIDKFNQNISAGMPPFSAVVYGATTRLRPIMMTTLTTVLALIPLAFGADGGAEMLSSMGIVVIGGLLFATIVTLFLTPILYSIICRIKVPKLNQNQEN